MGHPQEFACAIGRPRNSQTDIAAWQRARFVLRFGALAEICHLHSIRNMCVQPQYHALRHHQKNAEKLEDVPF